MFKKASFNCETMNHKVTEKFICVLVTFLPFNGCINVSKIRYEGSLYLKHVVFCCVGKQGI